MPVTTFHKTDRVLVSGHNESEHAQRPVYKFFHTSTPPKKKKKNMIGLLTLAAIPTTVAVSEAIAERDKNKNSKTDVLKEAQQLRKFSLRCYCAGSSSGKKDIHNGKVVVGDGRVFIQSPKAQDSSRLPIEGFYVEYPDPERTPQVLGLVTKVRTDPPLLNWIYIDGDTHQVKHANRSGSIDHWVGDFGATDNFEEPAEEDEDEPSGVTFDDEEKFVAVQPDKGSQDEKDGLWEIWWDEDDDKLNSGKKVSGKLVLRVNLERVFIEEEGA